MWFFGRGSEPWERIGDNRNTRNIPGWVVAAFAKEPGSHGTRLIDHPSARDGESIYYKGRTYRYRVDLSKQKWQVYRKKRRGAKRK